MNPILKYPGAKWRLASWIISYFPQHSSYLEPFFGSGGVFFNKTPVNLETINDIDGNVINFFRVCREHPDDLARAISLTPWARAEQELVKRDPQNPINEVEQARRFAVNCWETFGSRCRNSSWRYSSGKSKDRGYGPNNTKLWGTMPDVIYQVAERLKDAQIENRPAVDVIRKFNGPKVLIYADPPYLKRTRTLNGDQYDYEMTDTEHLELLTALKEHEGYVILSGYENELYKNELKGWETVTTKARAEKGVIRTESLYINPKAYAALPRMNLF